MNNMFIVVLVASVIVAVVLFTLFLRSASWEEVPGEIVYFQIDESYISTTSVSSSNRNLFNYKIDVRYKYAFEGQEYEGNKLVAGLPNVTSDKNIADQMAVDYAVGNKISVFVDVSSPQHSSLQTAKSFGLKAFLMLFFLMMLAGLFLFGFMYFKKMMNE